MSPYFNVMSAHWSCEKCQSKAIKAFKTDELVDLKWEFFLHYCGIKVMNLKKQMSMIAS